MIVAVGCDVAVEGALVAVGALVGVAVGTKVADVVALAATAAVARAVTGIVAVAAAWVGADALGDGFNANDVG